MDEALAEFLAPGFVHVSTVGGGRGYQHIVERDRNLIVEILRDWESYSISASTIDQPEKTHDYDIVHAALAGTAFGRIAADSRAERISSTNAPASGSAETSFSGDIPEQGAGERVFCWVTGLTGADARPLQLRLCRSF
ncbi:MAG: hypothetical protein U0R50_04310 [Gaiellales bacterium]